MLDNYQKTFFNYDSGLFSAACYRISHPAENLHHVYSGEGYCIDMVLSGDWLIDGERLREGRYRISAPGSWERIFSTVTDNRGILFSVSVTGIFSFKKQESGISAAMMWQLLEMMDTVKQGIATELWISSKMIMLLNLFVQQQEKDSILKPVRFEEAEAVYHAIEFLPAEPGLQLSTHQVIERSGMKKYRFQKVCRALYGLSIREILYERSMSTALDLLTQKNQSPEAISRQLGYGSHENFITGFKRYFDVTPAVMQKASAGF